MAPDETDAGMKAEIERLRAENERLKSRQTRGVSLKVTAVAHRHGAGERDHRRLRQS